MKRIAPFTVGVLLLFANAVPVAAADGPGAAARPAAAAQHPVVDDYFGTKVTDPYRWMENAKDPEFVSWLRAQADYTKATLDRIPGRTALLERIRQLDNAGTSVGGLVVRNGMFFYTKLSPGDAVPKVYVRAGIDGPERLLIDPEKLGTADRHAALSYYDPSHDAKYLAYGIAQGGSEETTMHVLEVASGTVLADTIDRARFGAVSWRDDDRSFTYLRLRAPAPGEPAVAMYRDAQTFVHELGKDPSNDPAVFGRTTSPAVKIAPEDFPGIVSERTTPYAIGVVRHGVLNELTLYRAAKSQLGGSSTPWESVADIPDAVTDFAVHGDRLFLLTHKGAARFQVLETSLARPDIAHARVVVPPSTHVIRNIASAADALYINDLDGGIARGRRFQYSDGKITDIPLPFDGSSNGVYADDEHPGVYVSLQSWTRSSTWFHYDPFTNRLVPTSLVPPNPVDFSSITSEEVKAKSADGTMIPLSIIHRKDLALDGSHPTLLSGYGAYGITQEPSFSPTRLAWLERGGVFAVAHVRGGGEYGEDWHLGGFQATKPNTFLDFIACGQYLVDHRYTTSAKLGGIGGSAGGITIGGSLTHNPGLFAAMLDLVPVSDNLRIETTPNGPPNIPEFGSTKTQAGFNALYAMSAYHHVVPGVKYPAVMLTTGINDPRVDSWQAAKMGAALQANTTSGKPVLIRVDYDAGHGIGSTRPQNEALQADEYSFLLWQFGDPQFAPAR